MGWIMGLEPTIYCLEGSCSIQLGYWRISNGAGDGNRTCVSSLEGWCSTIELHPRKPLPERFSFDVLAWFSGFVKAFFRIFSSFSRARLFPPLKRKRQTLQRRSAVWWNGHEQFSNSATQKSTHWEILSVSMVLSYSFATSICRTCLFVRTQIRDFTIESFSPV